MPLELCAMVVVLLASVFVSLFPMVILFVPLYEVPLTVTDQFFEAVESILPSLVDINSNFQLIVDVLFAIDWLVVDQLNFKVFQSVTLTLVLPLLAIMCHPLYIHNLHFRIHLVLFQNHTD